MSAIITTNTRILNSDLFKQSIENEPTYVFFGKDTEWDDEAVPDNPVGSSYDLSYAKSNILGMKRIDSSNTLSVVRRINWAINTVYDRYDQFVNQVEQRKTNLQPYNFYVLTDEFNVYKCLSNNSGSQSTVKPSGQQINSFTSSDGYVWQYMYTLNINDVLNYLTVDWMPIYNVYYNDGSGQWSVKDNTTPGSIHTVEIVNGGNGYSVSSPPTINVEGDGTNFNAIPVINPTTGAIESITITDTGSNYTSAQLFLVNEGTGSGASLIPHVSPANGHGYDSRSELGGTHIMVKTLFEGEENGLFPITSFRQAGIIKSPKSNIIGTKLVLDSLEGFVVGDTLTGSGSGATGVISSINPIENTVYLDSVTGVFIQTEMVSDSTHSNYIIDVDSSANIPLVDEIIPGTDLLDNSGTIVYLANRKEVQRGAGQNEEVRFVISF